MSEEFDMTTSFSRPRTSDSEKLELRINIPKDLMAMVDAIAQAQGSNRGDVVTDWLTEKSMKISHEAIVLARMLRGNPMLSDNDGKPLA